MNIRQIVPTTDKSLPIDANNDWIIFIFVTP